MWAWTLLFAGAMGFAQSLWSSENPLIRVRLKTAQDSLEIEGIGIRIQGRQRPFELVALPQRRTFKIQRESIQGKMAWRILSEQGNEILFEPALAIQGRDIRSKGQLLPNHLFLAPQNEAFDVVGVLPLENYLVGVIASEMPLSWPFETLKAQTIAARSYALVTMKERAQKHFHIESTILDQVFSHIGNGPDDSPLVAKAKLAVKQTAGMVLLSPKSKILKAYYHADCGGKTSDARTIWGFGESTGSAVDSSCPLHPKAHWTLKLKSETLTAKILRYLEKPHLGSILNLKLIRPSPGERIENVEVSFESGEKVLMAAPHFRSALGYDQLKSALFDVESTGTEFQFRGQGFGHGVGLCQWGAKQLALNGRHYGQILTHYYPKARLVRIGQEPEIQIR